MRYYDIYQTYGSFKILMKRLGMQYAPWNASWVNEAECWIIKCCGINVSTLKYLSEILVFQLHDYVMEFPIFLLEFWKKYNCWMCE